VYLDFSDYADSPLKQYFFLFWQLLFEIKSVIKHRYLNYEMMMMIVIIIIIIMNSERQDVLPFP
jgi:hypothetical protein